jgi:deoxyribodipyrimidine photo-lyase
MKDRRILVWLRNDLRLHDHEALYKAFQHTEAVFPVYCIDNSVFETTPLGFAKTDSLRANFLLESLRDLRNSLRKIGSDLIVCIGKPEEQLSILAEKLQITHCYAHKEVTYEETQAETLVEQKLGKKGILIEYFWQSTLIHLDDLPFPIQKLPDVFTDFRKIIEKDASVRNVFPSPQKHSQVCPQVVGEIPTLEQLGLEVQQINPKAAIVFKGGETEALNRLDEYFWKKNLLKNYKETRNELLGADYSSKFSAWLALGCISPRKIYTEVKKYEKEIIKNDSTYWLIFELYWRDYFRFIAKKYGNKIFLKEGIKLNPQIKSNSQEKIFWKWADGETGVPFIDANMRELNETGFMSNRGRQNVASFLIKDLHINWTWGASYFESKLIDYDVCSNWGNWTYIAGVGNDPRENRYFNILTQAQRYDPNADYVRYWIDSLQNVPKNKMYQLSQLPKAELDKYGVFIGGNYPKALVDMQKWVSEKRY